MSLSLRTFMVAGTGVGLTVIGLIIGCVAARVSTVTCIRDGAERQGTCRLEQSTLFLPWNKTVTSIQLNDVEKAESIELGVDSYTVALRLRNGKPNFLFYRTEYSQNSQQLAERINSLLSNPKVRKFRFREGGGLVETIILISFCVSGLLFAWRGTNFYYHASLRPDPVEK